MLHSKHVTGVCGKSSELPCYTPHMAIPVGTNDLKIYRRHASYCTRYPNLKNKPDTYRPTTKKDEKADTCDCPIWCRGYPTRWTAAGVR